MLEGQAGGFLAHARVGKVILDGAVHAEGPSQTWGRLRGIDAVPDELRRYSEIADFLSLEPKPVVLKLPTVPLSSVQSEKGGEAFIAEIGDRVVLEAMLSQLAFRIQSVIPFSEIEVLVAVDQHAV